MRWISMTKEIPVPRHVSGNVLHTEYTVVKINCMYSMAQKKGNNKEIRRNGLQL